MKHILMFVMCAIYVHTSMGQAITETPIIKLGYNFNRTAIISPNRRYIATAVGSEIQIWDTGSAKILKSFKGHKANITSLAFSEDQKLIVSGSEDFTAKVWDFKTGEVVRTYRKHKSAVTSVDISSEHNIVVTGSADHSVVQWQINSSRPTNIFKGHTDQITDVAISPNGELIISGSNDRTARVWNTKSGLSVSTLVGHEMAVTSVDISGHNEAATGSADKIIKIWIPTSGRMTHEFTDHTSSITDLTFSKNSTWLISASFDKTAIIWHMPKKEKDFIYKEHDGSVFSVSIADDNESIITASKDKTIKLWGLSFGKTERVYQNKKSPMMCGVFFKKNEMLTGQKDGKVKRWSIGSGNTIQLFSAHKKAVTAIDISPSGEFIATGSIDKTVKIFNSNDITKVKVLEGKSGPIDVVKFSNKGDLLFTAGQDKYLNIWDVASGTLKGSIKAHKNFITGIEVLKDNKHIVTSSEDKTIKVWDITNSTKVREFNGHNTFITCLSVSSDEKYMLSGGWNNTIVLWNFQTGEILNKFEKHTKAITGICFTNNSRYFISSSEDNTARAWDVQTGDVIEIYSSHKDRITSVGLSKNDEYIFTTSLDQSTNIWLSGSELTNSTSSDDHFVNYEVQEKQIEVYNPMPAVENDNIEIVWHTPSEKRYRDKPFVLNDNSFEMSIEIESNLALKKENFWLSVNGQRGGKFGEIDLETLGSEVEGTKYYNYSNKLTLTQGGIYFLKLNCEVDGKIIASSRNFKIQFEPQKIKLFVLSVGAKHVDLKYTENDAEDFGDLFEDHSLYESVSTRKLIGEEATASRIKLEMSRMSKNRLISERDMVILFFSSHGVVKENGSFCIQGADYDIVDRDATSVSLADIQQRLANLPCKKMLLIDACHSGVADPNLLVAMKDNQSKATRSALQRLLKIQDGWTMITSSGEEPSWEHEDWQNGSFTESIVDGLANGMADYDTNGLISIEELYQYLEATIPELNESVQYPLQYPQMTNTLDANLEIFQYKRILNN